MNNTEELANNVLKRLCLTSFVPEPSAEEIKRRRQDEIINERFSLIHARDLVPGNTVRAADIGFEGAFEVLHFSQSETKCSFQMPSRSLPAKKLPPPTCESPNFEASTVVDSLDDVREEFNHDLDELRNEREEELRLQMARAEHCYASHNATNKKQNPVFYSEALIDKLASHARRVPVPPDVVREENPQKIGVEQGTDKGRGLSYVFQQPGILDDVFSEMNMKVTRKLKELMQCRQMARKVKWREIEARIDVEDDEEAANAPVDEFTEEARDPTVVIKKAKIVKVLPSAFNVWLMFDRNDDIAKCTVCGIEKGHFSTSELRRHLYSEHKQELDAVLVREKKKLQSTSQPMPIVQRFSNAVIPYSPALAADQSHMEPDPPRSKVKASWEVAPRGMNTSVFEAKLQQFDEAYRSISSLENVYTRKFSFGVFRSILGGQICNLCNMEFPMVEDKRHQLFHLFFYHEETFKSQLEVFHKTIREMKKQTHGKMNAAQMAKPQPASALLYSRMKKPSGLDERKKAAIERRNAEEAEVQALSSIVPANPERKMDEPPHRKTVYFPIRKTKKITPEMLPEIINVVKKPKEGTSVNLNETIDLTENAASSEGSASEDTARKDSQSTAVLAGLKRKIKLRRNLVMDTLIPLSRNSLATENRPMIHAKQKKPSVDDFNDSISKSMMGTRAAQPKPSTLEEDDDDIIIIDDDDEV